RAASSRLSSFRSPKSAMGFWTTRIRWADGEFSADFPSHGKAKNSASRPMTASAFGAGVFRHFGPSSAVGGVSLRSQERENAAPGSRRLRNGASFPHDVRARLADRGEHAQHGGADLQQLLP